MNFVSFEQAAAMARGLAHRIPNDCDLVVGIPRSGLWPAAYLACLFGRPLLAAGGDDAWASRWLPPSSEASVKRILLVDDTVSTGKTMAEARAWLEQRWPGREVATAALIVQPGAESHVDYYHSVIPHPRLFEWNLAHASKGRLACDIDGVLCPDPPPQLEYEDPEGYAAFIASAPPHIIPAFEIELVISCRLQRWQGATEGWLRRNGVRYRQLRLWDLEDPRDRRGQHAAFKAACCAGRVDYIYESDPGQAQKLARLLGLPVLCISEMKLY